MNAKRFAVVILLILAMAPVAIAADPPAPPPGAPPGGGGMAMAAGGPKDGAGAAPGRPGPAPDSNLGRRNQYGAVIGGGGGGGKGGFGAASPGVGVPKSSVVAVDQQIAALISELKQLQIQADSFKTQIDVIKKKIEVGKEPPDASLPRMQANLEQVQEQISQVHGEITAATRLRTFATPIDISLKASPIRQAADALSRASKINIGVDPKVPQDIKVNAEAQNVPLGAVLEVIADAAGLIIAPAGDGDLLLRMPGKLVVGNNTYHTDGPAAPWSDDWGIPVPANAAVPAVPIGRRYLGLFDVLAKFRVVLPDAAGSATAGPPSLNRSW